MSDNPQVNQPSSGDYGEKIDLNRLKQALPQGTPVVGQAPAPAPIKPQSAIVAAAPNGRPTTGAALPPGIPSVIAGPTEQPQVPVTTPLSQPPNPMAGAATPDQGRLALLQMLSGGGPGVTPETQEWARHVLDILLGGQGQLIGG